MCTCFISDSLVKISFQPSGIGQNTVGQRQDVICSISVPPVVDPDTVELGWLNEDDIITDDGRVTIDASSYYNDSSLVTIIQFNPLIEDDEGEYICYAIINGSFIIESVILQKLTGTAVYAYTCLQNIYYFACTYVRIYMHMYYLCM